MGKEVKFFLSAVKFPKHESIQAEASSLKVIRKVQKLISIRIIYGKSFKRFDRDFLCLSDKGVGYVL
jgi:hypothetical protein